MLVFNSGIASIPQIVFLGPEIHFAVFLLTLLGCSQFPWEKFQGQHDAIYPMEICIPLITDFLVVVFIGTIIQIQAQKFNMDQRSCLCLIRLIFLPDLFSQLHRLKALDSGLALTLVAPSVSVTLVDPPPPSC